MKAEGMWCIFHPRSQTGDPGGEVGMVSEEELHTKQEEHFQKRPSRSTKPETTAGSENWSQVGSWGTREEKEAEPSRWSR